MPCIKGVGRLPERWMTLRLDQEPDGTRRIVRRKAHWLGDFQSRVASFRVMTRVDVRPWTRSRHENTHDGSGVAKALERRFRTWTSNPLPDATSLLDGRTFLRAFSVFAIACSDGSEVLAGRRLLGEPSLLYVPLVRAN